MYGQGACPFGGLAGLKYTVADIPEGQPSLVRTVA